MFKKWMKKLCLASVAMFMVIGSVSSGYAVPPKPQASKTANKQNTRVLGQKTISEPEAMKQILDHLEWCRILLNKKDRSRTNSKLKQRRMINIPVMIPQGECFLSQFYSLSEVEENGRACFYLGRVECITIRYDTLTDCFDAWNPLVFPRLLRLSGSSLEKVGEYLKGNLLPEDYDLTHEFNFDELHEYLSLNTSLLGRVDDTYKKLHNHLPVSRLYYNLPISILRN